MKTMNEEKTIKLFKTLHGWYAKYSDMDESIMTAFTRYAKGPDVKSLISKLNPEYAVMLKDEK